MEARGVYGWNDPIDPDGAARRPEPADDEPAWLTERPEPRSAYLFGDDPNRPADEWQREQPTARWQPEPARHDAQPWQPADATYRDEPAQRWDPAPTWQREEPTGGWRQDDPATWQGEPTTTWQRDEASSGWRHDEPAAGWQQEETAPAWQREETAAGWQQHGVTAGWHGAEATGGWQHEEPTGGWSATPSGPYAGEQATGTLPAVGADESPADGGRRRLRRPLLIGGAAAAATLVVSLGAGAVAFSGGDDASPASVADDTVAAAPALPGTGETPADALAPTGSPSASPTTAKPSPSVTASRKPTPAPSRTTAPSRRSPERSTAPSSSTGSGVSAQAREVVNLANAERAKAGCGALSIDDKLMTAAQRHSQDQADHQNMSHTGSDGSDPGDRIDRVGYEWRTYGENVAWNQKTPAAVMDAWMNSPGHRANILNCAFTEIGVGIASSNGPYWTQVFAAPR
nr:CAP domain-containing protein [Micromonospora thermarum]